MKGVTSVLFAMALLVGWSGCYSKRESYGYVYSSGERFGEGHCLDGERVGVRMWSPYVFDLTHLDARVHQFEVRVTHSMANEYEGAQRPSGMMGPVRIISAKTDIGQQG